MQYTHPRNKFILNADVVGQFVSFFLPSFLSFPQSVINAQPALGTLKRDTLRTALRRAVPPLKRYPITKK